MKLNLLKNTQTGTQREDFCGLMEFLKVAFGSSLLFKSLNHFIIRLRKKKGKERWLNLFDAI